MSVSGAADLSRRRSPSGVVGRLAEIWRYRFMLQNLVVRDLKVKYQRSALGFVWTFLNPALTVLVLIGVFSLVIRLPVEDYWAFLLSGYFVWNMVQHSLFVSSHTLQDHARLTRSVAFPSEVLLLGAALSRLLEFTIEITIILLVLVIAHHGSVPASLALVPGLMVLQLLLTLGFMLPIATLSAFFIDLRNALPVALTSLFYATPVFYPADMVPESLTSVYFLNPFAGLLTLYHEVVYAGRLPPANLALGSTVAAVLVFALGYAIYDRYRSVCAELV